MITLRFRGILITQESKNCSSCEKSSIKERLSSQKEILLLLPDGTERLFEKGKTYNFESLNNANYLLGLKTYKFKVFE